VGGQLGRNRAFNKLLKGKIPATGLPAAVTKLLDLYQAQRNGNESFQSFVTRVSKDDLLKTMG
jgi:sulfite reductase beta subunit-like hemoprotein